MDDTDGKGTEEVNLSGTRTAMGRASGESQ
ncbi:hypothetical protein SAMN02746065_1286 [Desulfocicer vacuolatum DSM 3385]|uniref:Uncharacterized protein n=1 Tax=Desulfocicer vacuolatum DSM 3385 TaxID=1121400 RepID=A0A1W2EBE4_9BACT|nr:hypothetical protein SAMN02746065_1286 [Desulfocicer vacuolatum DSM 3385]